MLAHVVRHDSQSEIVAYMAPENAAALLHLSQRRRAFVIAQRVAAQATQAHRDAFALPLTPDKARAVRDAWARVQETETALCFASRALDDAMRAAGIVRVELF